MNTKHSPFGWACGVILMLIFISTSLYSQAPSGITIDWTKTTRADAPLSNKFPLKPNFFE